MVEVDMRDESKILKIEGPPGHTALLVDGEVVTTHPDGKKIFRMAKEMERSKEYEGREISIFWIPNTYPFYLDPLLKYASLIRMYEKGIDPFEGKIIEEAE